MSPAPYRTLFSIAAVRRVVFAAVVSRLATSTLGLALLLTVHDRTGSYALAGFALTGRAIALAVASPAAGRYADRVGPRRALRTMLVVHGLAYAALIAVLTSAVPSAFAIAAAAAVGLSTPPNTPVIRALWPRIVPRDQLASAYAVDGVSNEVSFVAGPLAVAVLSGAIPSHWIIILAGASVLGGTLLIGREVTDAPVSVAAGAGRSRGGVGALHQRRFLATLTCSLWGAFAYGIAEVAAAFVADRNGSDRTAGVALSALAVGAVAGGLFAGRRFGADARLLGRLYALGSASVGAVIFVDGSFALTVVFLIIGLVSGPRDVIEQALAAETSSDDRAVEAFAWFNTFTWVGYAVGTSLAGVWASATGSNPSTLGVVACLAAAGIARWTKADAEPAAAAAAPHRTR